MPIDVSTLPELLDLGRRGVPDTAAALSDGTDAYTYGELSVGAGRLATALHSLGVRPGDRVGVHLRKSVHSFLAVHGVLRAGAVMVPLDPLAPADHVASVLVDAGAKVVITDARAVTVDALARDVSLTGVVVRSDSSIEIAGCDVVSWSDVERLQSAPIPDLEASADAYIIYTSGSTGRPKGIVHTHRSALSYARLAASGYELRSTDRFANIAGLHFDQSTFELYVAPYVGAAVTVVPDAVLRFPASLSQLVEHEQVTVWYSVPYVLRQLVTRGALETRNLSAIRWILYGGEAYPVDELRDLMDALPGAVVSNVYGPAEVNQCMRHDLTHAPPTLDAVPIGRPWPQTELIVVGTNDEPAADGAGELLVASVTMMDRYWARPDLTSAAIVERSFPDHVATRWYRTGDLVETDASGDLVFLGRSDNQVKIRGQRIELEAIDNTIRELDTVEEAAVVVVADEAGERVIVAMVQYSPGATLSTRELQRHVGTRHPRVAIPAELVAVARLPRTGTGKVDRNAALERIGDRKER